MIEMNGNRRKCYDGSIYLVDGYKFYPCTSQNLAHLFSLQAGIGHRKSVRLAGRTAPRVIVIVKRANERLIRPSKTAPSTACRSAHKFLFHSL